jgi:AraC-like DNA-binding protein
MTGSSFRVLYVGMGRYGAGEPFGDIRFPHFDLFTVWEGSVRLRVGARDLALASGDAVVIPPNRHFHGSAGPHGARLWVMHFTDWPDLGALPGRTLRVIPGVLAGAFERMAAERLFELPGGGNAPRAPEADAIGLYLLSNARWRALNPGMSGGRRLRFEALLARARSGFASGTGVSELARESELSSGYFRVCFRREFGKNPATALREVRMSEARRLLAGTRTPIKQIAVELGYSEPSAFHRAFQRESGKTPAEYRLSNARAV